jgi:hypothetical protein
VDYRSFLGTSETVVLPYFGGTRIDAEGRRYQLKSENELAPGWWRFQIEGRRAVPKEPASPVDLAALPAVRGHFVDGWVIVSGREAGRIALPPEDEPQALSRVTARRWYSKDLLFDTLEFEDDAELAARDALEQRRSIAGVKGVVPSLRAAFGYALGLAIANELRAPVSPREIARDVVAIAEGGPDVARRLFAGIIAQREREAEEARRRVAEAAEAARLAHVTRGARVVQRSRDPVQRADDALDGAGARLLSVRRINNNTMLDVVYDVDGTRIISTVDIETLQVIDPGVCLAGAHRVLALDAMPSVIREAIEEDHLNITRRA